MVCGGGHVVFCKYHVVFSECQVTKIRGSIGSMGD